MTTDRQVLDRAVRRAAERTQRADAVMLDALRYAFPEVRVDVNRRDAVMSYLHEKGVDVDALDEALSEGRSL